MMVTKKCRVCGKEYRYCTTRVPPGEFRWQDVACSRECGETYFKRILASRGQTWKEEK